jgi:hypothetical protein
MADDRGRPVAFIACSWVAARDGAIAEEFGRSEERP